MQLDPTKISAKYAAPSAQWAMVDALYGGTTTMRAAGPAYLPKNPKESDADYTSRLNRTTLYNAYKRSIQQAVARAFAQDLTLQGYPGEVSIFIEDVDAQNRDLTQFSKALFTDALHRGVSFFLVDFPFRVEQPLTLADALVSGDRPYWVGIQATQVLAAYSKLDGGSERLTHFRFREYALEVSADGLTESNIEQVRAFNQPTSLDPVTFTVWRKVTQSGTASLAPMSGGTNGSGWVVVGEGVLDGMTQIPVVCVYTDRTGFYSGKPPLMDLAELNVKHWMSTSEQANVLHVARVPFLFIKGMQSALDPDTGKMREQEISIHSVLTGAEDARWVETNGNALAAGFQDLSDTEAKMETLGMALTTPRSGTTTATETAVNTAEASSILKDYALALTDALEQGLYLTGLYLGLGELSGKVELDTALTVDLENVPEQVAPTE